MPRFEVVKYVQNSVTQIRVRDNLLKRHSKPYSAAEALDLASWLNDRDKSYTLTEADIRERIDSL